MGRWDDLSKLLARAHPQDLLSLLLPDAQYITEISPEFKVSSMQADFLCEAERYGQKIIVHVEFQKNKDEDMGSRIWKYNCAATIREGVPVYSFAIYLVKARSIAAPPFKIALIDGKVIHTFEYTNIFLWEMPPEMLMQKGMEGMLPLLPLTKNAKHSRDTILDMMTTGLHQAGKDDVLGLGYAFAGLVYKKPGDKQAIERRIAVSQNILEDSWFYQDVIKKGMEKGMQKGIEQGMQKGVEQGMQKGVEQGEMKTLRLMLIRVVKMHFPDQLSLAQEVAEQSTTPDTLNAKIDKLLLAKTSEEAHQALQEAE